MLDRVLRALVADDPRTRRPARHVEAVHPRASRAGRGTARPSAACASCRRSGPAPGRAGGQAAGRDSSSVHCRHRSPARIAPPSPKRSARTGPAGLAVQGRERPVGGGLAAPGVAAVHDVVVQERGGLEELHRRGHRRTSASESGRPASAVPPVEKAGRSRLPPASRLATASTSGSRSAPTGRARCAGARSRRRRRPGRARAGRTGPAGRVARAQVLRSSGQGQDPVGSEPPAYGAPPTARPAVRRSRRGRRLPARCARLACTPCRPPPPWP